MTDTLTSQLAALQAEEVEMLALLAEECGEVLQVIGKCLRHGLHSHHPLDPKVPPDTNSIMLDREVGDVLAAITMLQRSGILDPSSVEHACRQKLDRVARWLHHSAEYAGATRNYPEHLGNVPTMDALEMLRASTRRTT
jgi:NTP pyrophosphatase (non-canonical NTP hydrolase)